MGIQHIKIKNGSTGNAGKHSEYIAGTGRYGDRSDVLYLEDGNLPSWASNAKEFFEAADNLERSGGTQRKVTKDGAVYEKSFKGRAYKEIEAAIPRESDNPVQWAKNFANETIGNSHAYRLAIHDKEASDGGRNIHIHLMFSTREIDGHDRSKEEFFKRAASNYRNPKTKKIVTRQRSEGGAIKSKFWNSRESVTKTREVFERHVQRVSPEFKMERSSNPEPKIGPNLDNAGEIYKTERGSRHETVKQIRSAKKELALIDSEIRKEGKLEKSSVSSNDQIIKNIDKVVIEKNSSGSALDDYLHKAQAKGNNMTLDEYLYGSENRKSDQFPAINRVEQVGIEKNTDDRSSDLEENQKNRPGRNDIDR